MSTIHFPAIVERSDTGVAGYFPDLPGCVSAADTVQDLALSLREALLLHLDGMAEDGDPIPAPTPLDELVADQDVEELGRLLIPADLPGRKVRININMDESLIAAIDAVDRNRSGFLARAARAALRDREPA